MAVLRITFGDDDRYTGRVENMTAYAYGLPFGCSTMEIEFDVYPDSDSTAGLLAELWGKQIATDCRISLPELDGSFLVGKCYCSRLLGERGSSHMKSSGYVRYEDGTSGKQGLTGGGVAISPHGKRVP